MSKWKSSRFPAYLLSDDSEHTHAPPATRTSICNGETQIVLIAAHSLLLAFSLSLSLSLSLYVFQFAFSVQLSNRQLTEQEKKRVENTKTAKRGEEEDAAALHSSPNERWRWGRRRRWREEKEIIATTSRGKETLVERLGSSEEKANHTLCLCANDLGD